MNDGTEDPRTHVLHEIKKFKGRTTQETWM